MPTAPAPTTESNVAAAEYRLDEAVFTVGQRAAQFPNALHERIVRDCHPWPDCVMQLLLRYKSSHISREVMEDV